MRCRSMLGLAFAVLNVSETLFGAMAGIRGTRQVPWRSQTVGTRGGSGADVS